MPLPNIGGLRSVSDRLEQLNARYAFVGGSIVNLLLDDPQLSRARPTDDVDVILEAVTSERYSEVEAKLRTLGFEHDTRQGAPLAGGCSGDLSWTLCLLKARSSD
jgi:hypothetical protein